MTVEQLIERLKRMPKDTEVMITDCVAYRDMRGPFLKQISEQDADDHGDCYGRVGETIVVL